MTIGRVLALVLVLSFRIAAQTAAQTEAPRTPPKADDRMKADVLLIVAHPDDETGVSGYLAQLLDQGKRVAAVYLTHGEAGHNNMGRERAVSLGAHVRDERTGILVLAPAREQLELEPADFVERIADRVEDAPRRRAVLLRGSGIEPQILADGWQRERWSEHARQANWAEISEE